MKKITYFITLFFITQIGLSQTISYEDAGVLFSQERIEGTARFNALSGAFGALGGDLSAIGINPAGGSVFNHNNFSVTLGLTGNSTDATYYNTQNKSENDYTSISQAGGIFVFRSSRNKGWNKSTFSFNYNNNYDFRESWLAKGNSNNPTFINDPKTDKVASPLTDGQSFGSFREGKNKKYTFGLSTKYNNDLYLGASLNTYELNFHQGTELIENNRNAGSKTLDARLRQDLFVTGNGISVSFGVIGKPTKNLRLGIAYHSPVWYSLSEEFIGKDLSIQVDKITALREKLDPKNYEYKLKSPSKVVGSVAYVFGKRGLISIDYSHKNYSNINYQSVEFTEENKAFTANLKSAGEFRLGTEWIIKRFYIRGGYHYSGNPYKEANGTDALQGFSLGTGYAFKGGRIDIAYQGYSQTTPYDFYPEYNDLKNAELSQKKNLITATLALNL